MLEIQIKNIQEILNIKGGFRIVGNFLIKESVVKVSNNGNKYIDFELIDSSGQINAKLWEYKEDYEIQFKANTIVRLISIVNDWKGVKQLKIENIELIKEEINIDQFVPSAPIDSNNMYNEILKYCFEIEDLEIQSLVNYFLKEKKKKLLFYPAAKSNHHSIKSGLLFHILTMLKMAKPMLEIYPYLNKDLLYAGIILHDIAKLEEMDSNKFGIVDDYSIQGKLLGHIVLGITQIEKAALKLEIDNKKLIILQHMILSHHYEADYGSPKKPMIPEAEMLHHLDTIDARMYDMQKALQETNEDQFSPKIWSLEGRSIFKYSSKK